MKTVEFLDKSDNLVKGEVSDEIWENRWRCECCGEEFFLAQRYLVCGKSLCRGCAGWGKNYTLNQNLTEIEVYAKCIIDRIRKIKD